MESCDLNHKIVNDELWEGLAPSTQEYYRAKGDAIVTQFYKMMSGQVVKYSDSGYERIMTSTELEAMINNLKQHRDDWDRYSPKTPLHLLVSTAIDYLKNQELARVAELVSTRDDVLTYLRALSLIAETVGNAGTHHEKEVRLRGFISLLETAIAALKKRSYGTITRYWEEQPDIFRSKYPVAGYIYQIHKLREELKQLKGETKDSPDDTLPI